MGLRVLVLDDHLDMGETLAALLRGLGHDARCARSLEELRAVTRGWTPDAALIDFILPGLPAHDVVELVRIRAPNARIAVLVGPTSPDIAGLLADRLPILRKPVDGEEVERWLTTTPG